MGEIEVRGVLEGLGFPPSGTSGSRPLTGPETPAAPFLECVTRAKHFAPIFWEPPPTSTPTTATGNITARTVDTEAPKGVGAGSLQRSELTQLRNRAAIRTSILRARG